jgi:hypothetical protein
MAFTGLTSGGFFLGIGFALVNPWSELADSLTIPLSWVTPYRHRVGGVFSTPRCCPVNLTFKQLVIIVTVLLLLAVGLMYEAYTMFP